MRKKTALISLTTLLFFVITGQCFADVVAQFEQAETLIKNGQYGQAEQIYLQILKDYPGSDHALKAQKKLAMLYINTGKDSQAEAAYQQLIANFSQNPSVAKAVWQIAQTYKKAREYQKAIELYRYVVNNWPGDIIALSAQSSLAISFELSSDKAAADAAYERLLQVLPDYEVTAEDVYWIAKTFNWANLAARAAGVHQYNVEHFPGEKHALWSQVEVIFHHIRSGDESASNTEVDRFLSIFAGHPALPRDVYNVAKEYDKAGRHRKALELYQYVIEHRPADEDIYARMSASMAYIGLGDDADALAVTDGLISDFYGHSDLAGVVFHIGEQYYEKAFQAKNEGLEAQAKENFEKTLTVLEKIITQLPPSEPNTPHAYLFAGECYRRLGEHEKAVEYFQQVVDDWPDYQYACNAQCIIGECYEKLRDSGALPQSEANPLIEQAYQAVIEKYPDCSLAGHAHLKLSKLSSEMGQLVDAAEYYELFLENYPQDTRYSQTLYHLARTYEKMGELDRAVVEIYRIFLEIAEPGDWRIKAVQARLARLQAAQNDN